VPRILSSPCLNSCITRATVSFCAFDCLAMRDSPPRWHACSRATHASLAGFCPRNLVPAHRFVLNRPLRPSLSSA
jgi:hypothetical protein